MATLTRGQKAAQTRLRNAEASGQRLSAISNQQADSSVNFDKVFLTLADGMSRLEKAVLHSIGSREQVTKGLGQQDNLASQQVGSVKLAAPQSGPPPLSDLLCDAAHLSAQVLEVAQQLRNRILHGDVPADGDSPPQNAAKDSFGPAKNASIFIHRNLVGIEDCIKFISAYLLS